MNALHRFAAAVLLLACAGSALGQRLPEQYERVLVPVLPIGQWFATLWIHNDGPDTVDLFPLARDAGSPSRGQRLPLFQPGLPPGRTLEYQSNFSAVPLPYYVPLTSHAGAILYVERGKRANVRMQLRVEGAQVPVVAEQDFVAAPMSLLRISVIPRKRYTLRVYSLDSDGADVQVAFEPTVGGAPVEPVHLRLQRPDAVAGCAAPPCPWPDVPFTPAYAALFFDVANVPNWLYRITVTPSPGARIWTFLSETDVETRAIRIYTPN